MSSKINSKIDDSNNIEMKIEEPLKYFKDIENYLKMIIFYIIIDYKNISYDNYGIKNNKLDNLFSFVYEEKNKNLTDDLVIFNNNIFDFKDLLKIIFDKYFNYIEKFLYTYFDEQNINNIIKIFNIETNQKNIDIFSERLNYIKTLYNKKIKDIYNDYDINNISSLLSYIDDNIEFGTIVNIKNHIQQIPFGTIEAEEGKNNKIVTYDNHEINKFLNEYYEENKNEINPTNINITKLLKSISSVNYIIFNKYKLNYPLDIFKYKVANSFEQMEFIALFLEANNIKYKRIVFSIKNDNNIIINSHFFIVFNKNKYWYYIDSTLSDYMDIYKYDSLNELLDTVMSKMIYTKEINPYKEININKYSLNFIDKLKLNMTIEEINEKIINEKKYDNKNAIFMYKCENEIRKNILKGNFTAHNYKKNYLLVKPENNYDNENDYKEDYLKILNENIMNLCYKNNDSGYFKVNKVGDKEYESIEIKKEVQETKHQDQKYNKNAIKLLFFIIIIVIIAIFTHFCGKH